MKIIFAVMAFAASSVLGATKVSFDASNNAVIDGKTMFPLSLAILPPADAKAPDGKSAWEEFHAGGITCVRVVTRNNEDMAEWDEEGFKSVNEYLNRLAAANMYAWLTLPDELAYLNAGDTKTLAELTKVVNAFKDNRALFGWKGADEPAWGNMLFPGKKPPSSIATTYKTMHELDPHHPVIVLQAPRGTAAINAPYDPYLDITGMDIFPIAYPPGNHVPTWPNKEISMTGDWTRISMEMAGGKPVWMTLQIAFSGTAGKGKTLRFPTFEQERFMTYEAIINGARGINWFGGGLPQTLNDRDRKLGYNWTFWERVLKPVLAEINENSPLHEAMIAPNSKLPVKVEGKGIEYAVREVGDEVYILACKREGETIQVKFSGLPANVSSGDVMYEEPRKVAAKEGSFTDWFAPFDVHVYHFKK